MYPEYSLQPNLPRMLLPRCLQTLLLLVIFGAALVINLNLLGLELNFLVYAITIIVVVILFFLDIILYYTRVKLTSYNFYPSVIEIKGKKSKQANLGGVERIDLRRNVFDKPFSTATIVLGKDFKLKGVVNYQRVYEYSRQLWQRMHGQFYQ